MNNIDYEDIAVIAWVAVGVFWMIRAWVRFFDWLWPRKARRSPVEQSQSCMPSRIACLDCGGTVILESHDATNDYDENIWILVVYRCTRCDRRFVVGDVRYNPLPNTRGLG